MLEKLPSVTFTKGKIQVAILCKKLFLIGFLMLLSLTPLTVSGQLLVAYTLLQLSD